MLGILASLHDSLHVWVGVVWVINVKGTLSGCSSRNRISSAVMGVLAIGLAQAGM